MWHPNDGGYVAIPAAGTPVRVTVTRTPGQTLFFQQLQGNTGKLWICSRADANKTTGVGILAMIAAPTLSGGVAVVLPYAAVTIPTAPSALNLAEFWIDADINGDQCLVSYVRQ